MLMCMLEKHYSGAGNIYMVSSRKEESKVLEYKFSIMIILTLVTPIDCIHEHSNNYNAAGKRVIMF